MQTEAQAATRGVERERVLKAAQDLRRAVLPNEILRQLRATFGLRQITVAAACGASARAVRLWENGGTMRTRHSDRIGNLADTVLILSNSLVGNGFDQWLWARIRLLDGKRPVNALASGDEAAVLDAARAFVRGDYV